MSASAVVAAAAGLGAEEREFLLEEEFRKKTGLLSIPDLFLYSPASCQVMSAGGRGLTSAGGQGS